MEIRDASTSDLLHVLEGHTDNITSVKWSPDNRLIATGSQDRTAIIWDTDEGTIQHILSEHESSVSALAWSPDSSQLISSDIEEQPNLYVWDVPSGKLRSTHIGGSSVDMVFSPDGQKIAVSAVLVIGIRDSLTLEYIAQSPNGLCCSHQIHTLAWSPDSTRLVTGSINGLVTLWDADTATILRQFIANPHHQPDSRDVDDVTLSWVRDVTFSADGSTVLSVSGDETLREWQIDTGELVQETNISPLATARWSPYGGQLLVLELPQQNSRISSDQPFDASEIPAIPRIIVPDASPERLQAIAEACGATLPADSRVDLAAQLAAMEIHSACRADLLAVAAAMESE